MFNTKRGFTLAVVAIPHDNNVPSLLASYTIKSAYSINVSSEDMNYVGQRLAETMDMVIEASRRGKSHTAQLREEGSNG